MMGDEPTTVRANAPAPSRPNKAPLLPGPEPHARARMHALTLCCANSVAPIVEEVARALSGLGFQTEVITGSDARSAVVRTTNRRSSWFVCRAL